jgi:hypothetical protein
VHLESRVPEWAARGPAAAAYSDPLRLRCGLGSCAGGFTVEVVDDFDAARRAVLARIPEGAYVMTSTFVTLQ